MGNAGGCAGCRQGTIHRPWRYRSRGRIHATLKPAKRPGTNPATDATQGRRKQVRTQGGQTAQAHDAGHAPVRTDIGVGIAAGRLRKAGHDGGRLDQSAGGKRSDSDF